MINLPVCQWFWPSSCVQASPVFMFTWHKANLTWYKFVGLVFLNSLKSSAFCMHFFWVQLMQRDCILCSIVAFLFFLTASSIFLHHCAKKWKVNWFFKKESWICACCYHAFFTLDVFSKTTIFYFFFSLHYRHIKPLAQEQAEPKRGIALKKLSVKVLRS